MSLPNFADETLSFIGTNWNTSNYSPQPIRYNARTNTRLDTGQRTEGVRLNENAVVRVSTEPERTNTPIGTEYDLDVVAAANVRIEGLDESNGGTITDDDDFDALVEEVKRTLWVERTFPTSDDQVRDLSIEFENDLTQDIGVTKYRYDFDVQYRAYEELP